VLAAGRYRLVELIGEGATGRVWLARDEMLGRDVAVKEVVPPDWLTESERIDLRWRTTQAARAATGLEHPNLVRVHDVVDSGDRPWIVTDYVRSRSLREVVRRYGPLHPADAARMGADILAALTAAHRAGQVHRDVRPSNVLLTTDGRALLGDLGLSALDSDDPDRSRMLVVAPQYVAPERIRDGAATPAADLWALGATLYYAVEGRPPYDRDTASATLAAVTTEPPDPVRLAGPLVDVVLGLLRPQPERRMTAEEARWRLRELAEPIPDDERLDRADLVGPPEDDPLADRERLDLPTAGFPPPPLADGPRRPVTDSPPTAPAPEGPPAGSPLTVPVDLPAPDPAGSQPDPAGSPADPTGSQPDPTAARPGPAGEPLIGGLTGEPSDGSGARAHGPGRVLAGAALALVVLGGAAGGAWFLGGRSSDPGPAGGPVAAATDDGAVIPAGTAVAGGGDAGRPCLARPTRVEGTTGQGTATAGVRPSTGASPLPAGWTTYRDPTGFEVAVPVGWAWFTEGRTLCLRAPDGSRAFGVDLSVRPAEDPTSYWLAAEQRLITSGAVPRYTKISISPLIVPGGAAEWEYTFVPPGGRRAHVRRVLVNGSPTRPYVLTWVTPDADWPADQADYRLVQASFRFTS
jgi:serine/threonine protein kinase